MPICSIPHIPDRLKLNGRPIIVEFEIGEFLYMRCDQGVLDNPYEKISITELSHNRSGLKGNTLCNPDDVLFSIKETDGFEKYADKEICILEIKSLTPANKFKKTYSETKDTLIYNCEFELLHEPELCMYPHCVFRVVINEEIVTYANYKTTLRKVTKIRNSLKEELASMIVRQAINQNDTPV